jgi:hypothetical protein
MDPNATLDELRAIVAAELTGSVLGTQGSLERFDRMVELFAGLDDWLYGGGFLPAAWECNRKKESN